MALGRSLLFGHLDLNLCVMEGTPEAKNIGTALAGCKSAAAGINGRRSGGKRAPGHVIRV